MKAYRVGWIRRALYAADSVAEDLYAVDTDAHGSEYDRNCSFCVSRVALLRAIPQARRQLDKIEIDQMRKAFKARRRRKTPRRVDTSRPMTEQCGQTNA